MKERPILFSGPMIRAIIDGRKTQTRRVLKKQPLDVIPCLDDWAGKYWVGHMSSDPEPKGTLFGCKYGVPGDQLWVRETWKCDWFSHQTPTDGTEKASYGIAYKPDGIFPNCKTFTFDKPIGCAWAKKHDSWRPSIHMPRWASRIALEIVSVRVERVQDISTADIIAEGLSTTLREYDAECHLREQFEALWDSINGSKPGRSWADNPWVWCIEFRRLP
jgi:hypothetical protein